MREDSFALPLTSELDALCGENVHWSPLRLWLVEPTSNHECRPQKGKKNGIPNGIPSVALRHLKRGYKYPGIHAMREDSFALPLTSELDALCGENVNWIPLRLRLAEPTSNHECRPQKGKKNGIPNGIPFFFWRRHPDLNWGIEVLQTFALPLGYDAVFICAMIL